ncbi:MAG: homoserine dehydrogenase [Methylotenera sp.]|nr:homoserine dehydrogenase [Methylotenera sp.]MDP2281179.1 homoserine dehydrogenase [Methylotenera sp.]MDP3061274.1 homoserine dehydrogenase [Methylotenera sp.]
MKQLNVGILGLGTVGGGTYSVLTRNALEITRRTGVEIKVLQVADKNLQHAKATVAENVSVTDDAFAVVNNPEVGVVVELIGGYTLSKELVLKAIANKKHVVTANKALIATHGNEIFAAAKANNVIVAFEAAVAGGIPIIKALREGLGANHIEWVAGIINGTTNFILTEMREKGLNFSDVLGEAQRLGYAEADPTFDVEGIDAAHKLTIMSAIAFGMPMKFDQAYTEGITKLQQVDIKYAEELGYRVKLLGITKRTDKGVELRVHPTLIPEKRLVANVNGAMNAVVVKGDAVGPTLYYGAGAGAEPTASAVVADLMDVARLIDATSSQRVPYLAFQPDQVQDLPILPIDEVQSAYYLRLRASDKPGVLANVTKILGDREISIDAMMQKEPDENETEADIVILTHITVEKNMNAAITAIETLAEITGKVVRIRMEELAK